MIKREKTRKNPKKWRLASLAASGGGGGVCGSREGVGGSTPHPYWRCLLLIKTCMARNRYLEIKQRLHFCDENLNLGADPLFKVRFLLNYIRVKSKNLNQVSKEVSIDESLVGFKGRFKHILYISSKSTKFAIKFYVLAESKTGFMLNWICYCGKTDGKSTPTESIVHQLLESIDDNTGHELYCDNYYSSVSLAEKLSEKGISMTGTVRQNRKGLPLQFK